MNTYASHINPYDLAFLGTIFVGLNFALLLWFTKKANQAANRFLGLALVVMVLWMVRIWTGDTWLPLQLSLALGPLIYFYVLKLTRPAYKFGRKDLLHFIPVLLEQPFLQNPALPFLTLISVIIYLYFSHRLIERHYRRQKFNGGDRYRAELRWLHKLLGGFGLLWLLRIPLTIAGFFYYHQFNIQVEYPFYLAMAIMLIWIGATAYLRPEVSLPTDAPAFLKPSLPSELKQKGAWLKNLVKGNRYYEDPDLSLVSLAEKLELTTHELSRILNTVLKKSFNDFINEYRVAEVKRKMQDTAYGHMNLLGIAYDSGFNSKTTFNRAFKQATGKNPVDYKKLREKEAPSYNSGPPARFAILISNQETTPKWSPEKLNRNYMFSNYFKTTFRYLLQNKVYSFINIAGLSIGLACAMLILVYVRDEVSYDRFHQNADQIYRIDKQVTRDDGSVSNGSYTGYFPGPRFAANIPEIKSFVRFQPAHADIRTGSDIRSQAICLVDTNFFSVFSFPLLSGNARSVLSEPNAVVISEEMAKKYFGSSNAVGKIISIRQDSVFKPHVVTGVAKDCPQNSSVKFQVLLPLKVSAADESNNGNWFNSFLSTFVVLSPGVNIQTVQHKMDKVFESDAGKAISEIKNKYKVKSIGMSYLLEPLTAIHLGKLVPDGNEILSDKSNPEFSYILSAIAIFVLLIACINFINLTVARSVKRAREIGIRKVIGGTRAQLRIQFLTESFVLCLIAFILALGIVVLVLPVFSGLSNKVLSLTYLLNIKLAAYYIALFAVTSLLAGFYPSMILSGYQPVQTLYSRFSLAGKNYLQKALVVFQFALASFLIIGAIAIYLQFDYLTTQSLGYDDRDLIVVDKARLTRDEAALFRQELMKEPAIVAVAPKNAGDDNNTVKVNSDQQVNIAVETIDAAYLPLLKLPVIAGRNFSADYPADAAQSALVNEAFVKEAGWKQPVGQQIKTFNGETYTVIGVARDHHYRPLTEKIGAQFFTMNTANSYGMLYIRIKPGTETASLQSIAKTFKSLFPLSPFVYTFKQEQNEQSYATEARWKEIILFSAILTIFISCIGLFGLSMLAVEKRIKEIGVRKLLGASISSIVRILSTDFLKLILISLAIAMPFAWLATNKWLQNYPYRIMLSWWLFVSGGVLVVLIALITISFQSIKAAIANPVKSLRSE